MLLVAGARSQRAAAAQSGAFFAPPQGFAVCVRGAFCVPERRTLPLDPSSPQRPPASRVQERAPLAQTPVGCARVRRGLERPADPCAAPSAGGFARPGNQPSEPASAACLCLCLWRASQRTASPPHCASSQP